MLKRLGKTLILAEAVIGVTVSLLLILGQAERATVVRTLSYIGLVPAAAAALSLVSGARSRGVTAYAQSVSQSRGVDLARRDLRDMDQRYALVLCCLLISAILWGTAAAVHYLAP